MFDWCVVTRLLRGIEVILRHEIILEVDDDLVRVVVSLLIVLLLLAILLGLLLFLSVLHNVVLMVTAVRAKLFLSLVIVAMVHVVITGVRATAVKGPMQAIFLTVIDLILVSISVLERLTVLGIRVLASQLLVTPAVVVLFEELCDRDLVVIGLKELNLNVIVLS